MANIHWHLAYYGASKAEFNKNRTDLSFDREHHVTEESLRMDMLVIKKNPKAVIKNEIGEIFKTHNIWEFKGFKSPLNIDSYYRAVGYACIYQSQPQKKKEDRISIDEVTLSFLRQGYPRDLFRELKKRGVVVTQKYPGVYYLSGNIMFDTQVIVVKDLDADKHPALKVITKEARESDVRNFLYDVSLVTDPEELKELQAVLQVSMAANGELYEEIMRRDEKMTKVVKDVMKDVIAEERAEATADTKLVDIKELMKNMKWTAEQAMKALGISVADQAKYSAML